MSAFWPIWLGSATTNPTSPVLTYASSQGIGFDASVNSNVLRQTYINGFLDVSATTTLRYDVSINGNLFIAPSKKTYLGGDVSLGSRLFVFQDTSLNGNLYVKSNSTFNGDVSINQRLFVFQDTSLNGNLYIGKTAIFNSDVSINQRLFVFQDTILNGNLYIGKTAVFNSDVSMNGRLNLTTGNIYVNGILFTGGSSNFTTDVSINQRLIVLQDTSLNGNLYIGKKAVFNSDVSMNGNLVVYGNLSVQQQQNTSIINTTVNNYQLIISEDISLNGRLLVQQDASFGGNLVINSAGTGTTGFVGIGTSTNITYPLQVNGQIAATSFNATSDYRIKENVKPLDDAFTIDNIKPVTFTNTLLHRQDIGVIAHELQVQYPYLVTGEKDGQDNQTVNYTGFIGILIHEVKQLKQQMKELQEKMNTLTPTNIYNGTL